MQTSVTSLSPAPAERVTPGTTGMWVFLATDAMGFGGLLMAYGWLRTLAPTWPDAESRFNRPIAGGLTLLMLASAATVSAAATAARAGLRRRTFGLLAATAALGVAFLLGQYLEFDGLAHERQVPLTADHAAALFYVITGYHGLHVLAGVVLLAVLALRDTAGPHTAVPTAALYWQFVDVVWILLYVVFYLLPPVMAFR